VRSRRERRDEEHGDGGVVVGRVLLFPYGSASAGSMIVKGRKG